MRPCASLHPRQLNPRIFYILQYCFLYGKSCILKSMGIYPYIDCKQVSIGLKFAHSYPSLRFGKYVFAMVYGRVNYFLNLPNINTIRNFHINIQAAVSLPCYINDHLVR